MQSDYAKVVSAIQYLTNNVTQQPSLSGLAEFLGLSESHCHRLFKSWAGITPKNFLKVLTLIQAKRLLDEQYSLLDTAYAVGFSGSSRLHDLFTNLEAMTPGEYKLRGKGLTIYWHDFDTPLGYMTMGKTERGICSLQFKSETNELLVERSLHRRWPNAKLVKDFSSIKSDAEEVCARLTGNTSHPLKLFVGGTPFQINVWKALLNIPEGKLSTYGKIGESICCPKAVRAIGTAVGSNPIAYLIPCHRVIKSTGAIGEYYWGSDVKTALIAAEISKTQSVSLALS
jgi:AraC family transcriptional regulator of adaptative response/methylated-DNA-[protein]-cysteine methyltransferase